MEILKVKEFVNRHQFEILNESMITKSIKSVRRIKDSQVFNKFTKAYYEEKKITILSYEHDLINVNILTGNKPAFGLEFEIVNGKLLTKTIKNEIDNDTHAKITVPINNITL